MPAHKIPLAVRFWAKVDKSSECWLWTGATTRGGYGHIKVDGQMTRAHRVAYELMVGAIRTDRDLDHLCRTPLCVNPAHLEPVTRRENTMRGEGATAVHARKTQCKRGHEFTPENTYEWRPGGRACRTCRRDSQRKRHQAS